MLSRREFTERFGDPANFAFRGQAYPSSTPAKCALCGRDIRNVYSLCPPQGRSVPSGECCFGLFKKVNPNVYLLLLAARLLLDASGDGEKADIKLYNSLGDVNYRVSEWRKLRRKALEAVREYRKATGGDWLPKPLYDALEEASKRPGKTPRWFDAHIPALREKLHNLSI
jgi:hypothetical protein